MQNPFQFLPRTVFLLDPSVRIGEKIAVRPVKREIAVEYLRTGQWREQFVEGQFVGLIYSPQTAKPTRPQYIPEDMPPIEIPGLTFMQPPGATQTYLRTVTASI